MTPQQHKLLGYIVSYTKKRGYSPSFSEMCKAVGCASKANVARLVDGLKAGGYVTSRHKAARSVEVINLPQLGPLASGEDTFTAPDGRRWQLVALSS